MRQRRAKAGNTTPLKLCRVEGCGRRVRAQRLCQTHYKYQLQGRKLDPIPPKRLGRPGAIRFAGLTFTVGCARLLEKTARQQRRANNAVITDIIESWVRRHTRTRGKR